MAGLLELLAVPRASAISSASLSPIACSSSSELSGRRRFIKLPEFRGLKVQLSRSAGSSNSNSRFIRRGGRIVCEAQDTAVLVPPINDSTWQSLILDSSSPVLVEFWAPWCGPCRMIHPVIDELAKEYAGKLKCYKVNTDESPSIATKYGIRSIPTVIIFKGGEKRETIIGAIPKSTLIVSIEKFL